MYFSSLSGSRTETYSKPNLIILSIVLLAGLCRRWLLVATLTQLSYPAGGGRIFFETSNQTNFIPSWHIYRVPGRRTTKFCAAASNICECSVWILLHIILLTLIILKWLLDFWKICGSVYCIVKLSGRLR